MSSKDSLHLKEKPFGETRLHEKRIGACRPRPSLVSRLRESGHNDHDWVVKSRLLPYHIDEGHTIQAAVRKNKIGHDDVRSKTAENTQRRSGPCSASDLEIAVSQEVHVHLPPVGKAVDDQDALAALDGHSCTHTRLSHCRHCTGGVGTPRGFRQLGGEIAQRRPPAGVQTQTDHLSVISKCPRRFCDQHASFSSWQ
jgi:hypothetical protein